MLDHWRNPGDITSVPNPEHNQNHFDDRLLEDASFLRFKSLILSYSFAERLLKKTNVVQKARVYAQAYNLFTWTKYQGFDPEQYGPWEMGGYPQTRSFVFGVEIGF